jgi:preprotein translocase subunit SecF
MIDFLKYRNLCYLGSVLVVVLGIAAYAIRGGFRYHIDFTGGSEVRIAFAQPIDAAKLRTCAAEGGWHDAIIQSLGSNTEFLVNLMDNTPGIGERFGEAVKKSFPGQDFQIRSVTQVGPQAGAEVSYSAMKAVALALLFLLLYIGLRYRYAYAVGAIAALLHDLVVVLALIAAFAEPFSLNILAGILTMLGYSNNDTIVVFSRIKENALLHKGMSHYDLVNLSINQTLRRTLLVSFAMFMCAMSLYLFGGESLHGFSVVMLIAIVFGTYSSIFIASPVMLALNAGKEL